MTPNAPVLEYETPVIRTPLAAWMLRGWALTNWMGALFAIGLCVFFMYKWGWSNFRRDSLIVTIVLLLGASFVTTLCIWGLQCWWYGNSVQRNDVVAMRRARGITILLSVLWLLCVAAIAWMRFHLGTVRLDSTERFGWWIICCGTSSFLTAATMTVGMLTWSLRHPLLARPRDAD